MYRVASLDRRRGEPGSLDERAQVIECDAPVDLDEGPLDELFELWRRHDARTRESQQLAPGVRRETPTLMWSENAKHWIGKRS